HRTLHPTRLRPPRNRIHVHRSQELRAAVDRDHSVRSHAGHRTDGTPLRERKRPRAHVPEIAGREKTQGAQDVSTTQKVLRMSRIVITGAPGAGKTTLLLTLQARGYTIVRDTARAIIQDRRRRGLSPRPEPYVFAQEMLRIDIENFVRHEASREPVFF